MYKSYFAQLINVASGCDETAGCSCKQLIINKIYFVK